MLRFRIRTNWTNSISKTYEFGLDDLADAAARDRLKWAFSDPERLRPGETRQSLTERAAAVRQPRAAVATTRRQRAVAGWGREFRPTLGWGNGGECVPWSPAGQTSRTCTGTPTRPRPESTRRRRSPIYDIQRAVEDGVTVPIY